MFHLTLVVQCPKNHLRQKMYIDYHYTDENKIFYFPCNGCDSASGSGICEKCRAAVTLMFMNGYEYSPGTPIIPDFSKLR